MHAEAVASGGVIVKLGGDVRVHQGGVVDDGIPAVTVVLSLDEEGGWGEFVGCVGGIQGGVVGRGDEVGGVDEDGEVGAGADRVGEHRLSVETSVHSGNVGGGWGGGYVVVVGVGADEGGEVGPGGEAHHADVRGVEVPVGGVSAGEAHGLLRVFEIRGVGGVVSCFAGWLGDAVLDEDAGDSDGVEPVAGVGAFAVGDKDAVATAWEDENRSAGVFSVRGIDGERRDGDVGEADDAVAAEEVVGGLGGVGLGGGGLWGFRGGVGPEGERQGLALCVRNRSEKREGEECSRYQAESGIEAFHADYSSPDPARRAMDGGKPVALAIPPVRKSSYGWGTQVLCGREVVLMG